VATSSTPTSSPSVGPSRAGATSTADVRVVPTAALPAGIRSLLDEAFAGRFDDTDWDHAVGGHHVVVTDGGAVVAHAAVVPRDLHVDGHPVDAGYVEAVATAPARRREGFGTRVMEAAGDVVRRHHGIGALSTGAHAFYERLGWERWRGPTFVRRGHDLVRTPEEDDGIMVLRFGPSAGVDLTAPLSCEARTGDDW
jgi:aminoglycoside 2'-N-acetyltransferase I